MNRKRKSSKPLGRHSTSKSVVHSVQMPSRKKRQVEKSDSSDVNPFTDPVSPISGSTGGSKSRGGSLEFRYDHSDDESEFPTSIRSSRSMPEFDGGKTLDTLVCCLHGLPCESAAESTDSQGEEKQYDNLSSPTGESEVLTPKYGFKSPALSGSQSADSWTSLAESDISAAPVVSGKQKRGEIASVGSLTSLESATSGKAADSADYVVLTVDQPNELHSADIRTEHPRLKRQQKANKIVEQKTNSPDPDFKFYVGVLTRAEAEDLCDRPASFLLYHRFPSVLEDYEALAARLMLYVVYCTSQGEHRHYRIKERWTTGALGFTKEPRRQFCVRVPKERSPYFFSLKALVRFYATYSHLNGPTDTSGHPDIFPWWESDEKAKVDEPDESSVSPLVYAPDPALLD